MSGLVGQVGALVQVCEDAFGLFKVAVVDYSSGADVWEVVELRDGSVQLVWASVPIEGLDLGTEVAEDDDSGLVWADEDGADQKLEVLEPLGVAIVSQKLQDKLTCCPQCQTRG